MTVVVAMYCGTYLVVGAETQGERAGEGREIKFPVSKLDSHPSAPLAWGFASDLGIGEEFSSWVKRYAFEADTDWYGFRDNAAKKLGRLNKVQRERTRNAGAKDDSDNLGKALIVGYIGNSPEILELTEDGATYFHLSRRYAAIGSGASHAYIAKHTVERWRGSPEKHFLYDTNFCGFVTLMAAETDTKSGGAPGLLKVTPSGVEPLALASQLKTGSNGQ